MLPYLDRQKEMLELERRLCLCGFFMMGITRAEFRGPWSESGAARLHAQVLPGPILQIR